jgi:hypothetical protein
MRVSLKEYVHIEAPVTVREGGPLGSENVFAQGIRILLSTLEF